MWFSKKKNIDYDNLVSILEKGDQIDVQKLLWQPKQGHVEYLPVTIEMLRKLKSSETSNQNLSVFKKLEKGNYELIIFNTPWSDSDLPFSPLVLDKVNEKIVGVMLPFNELYEHISKRDNSVIGDLGVQWVRFTLDYRFKK